MLLLMDRCLTEAPFILINKAPLILINKGDQVGWKCSVKPSSTFGTWDFLALSLWG